MKAEGTQHRWLSRKEEEGITATPQQQPRLAAVRQNLGAFDASAVRGGDGLRGFRGALPLILQEIR